MGDAMAVAGLVAMMGRFHLGGHPGARHYRRGACGTGRNRMVILPFF
jgi:hypothetical protein